MPFGLKNAPATFQRLMESVLAGLIRKSCLDYLDDIVTGEMFAEHLDNLRDVFLRLRAAKLRLKPIEVFSCNERGRVSWLQSFWSRDYC